MEHSNQMTHYTSDGLSLTSSRQLSAHIKLKQEIYKISGM